MALHDTYRRRREAIYGSMRQTDAKGALKELLRGLLRILLLAAVAGLTFWLVPVP